MNFSRLLQGFVKVLHGFIKVVTWIFYLMFFLPFGKQNQTDVWPRFQSLLKLLICTTGVQWVKVHNALGPFCLWQWQCFPFYLCSSFWTCPRALESRFLHFEPLFPLLISLILMQYTDFLHVFFLLFFVFYIISFFLMPFCFSFSVFLFLYIFCSNLHWDSDAVLP